MSMLLLVLMLLLLLVLEPFQNEKKGQDPNSKKIIGIGPGVYARGYQCNTNGRLISDLELGKNYSFASRLPIPFAT
jgi:hypothetical protein